MAVSLLAFLGEKLTQKIPPVNPIRTHPRKFQLHAESEGYLSPGVAKREIAVTFEGNLSRSLRGGGGFSVTWPLLRLVAGTKNGYLPALRRRLLFAPLGIQTSEFCLQRGHVHHVVPSLGDGARTVDHEHPRLVALFGLAGARRNPLFGEG